MFPGSKTDRGIEAVDGRTVNRRVYLGLPLGRLGLLPAFDLGLGFYVGLPGIKIGRAHV